MPNPKKESNMKMIAAAVIVIVIIAIGALVLVGNNGKKSGQQPSSAQTSSIPSTIAKSNSNASSTLTTAPTTTVQSGSSNQTPSLESYVGQNITLQQFKSDVGSALYATTPSHINVSYNYTLAITSTGTQKYSFNATGHVNVAEYYKNFRITSLNNGYGGNHTVVSIYNASTRTDYVCSNASGSYTCVETATNANWSNGASLGYFSGLTSNNTSGYLNNITVSTSSYNGQPCTLMSASMHVVSTSTGSPTITNGKSSMCLAEQTDALLTMNLQATVASTMGGKNYTSNLNYVYNEVSMSSTTSPAITNLPGSVSNQ